MAAKSNTRTATAVKKEAPPRKEEKPRVEKRVLSEKQLLEMYSLLYKCRQVDERGRLLFRQGKFKGNFYSAVGQEATHVGSLYGCRKSDWVGPSHRDMVAAVVKG
ncbi:MAG: hypothetical protein HYY26_00140, partial [Acidobacteria bacterium]|nr:hypothetical protein [Acidobacteriota bacterium]